MRLRCRLGVVLDADAIRLCSEVAHKTKIVTPHDGEFERYFGKLTDDRVAAAVEIARAKGAVVVLKGAHTLVAAPDGRVSQNQTASPHLAKAGTGDVLAGLVAGLLAQGMPAFDAASAGVWLHGAASLRVGPGLSPRTCSAKFARSCATYWLRRAWTLAKWRPILAWSSCGFHRITLRSCAGFGCDAKNFQINSLAGTSRRCDGQPWPPSTNE